VLRILILPINFPHNEEFPAQILYFGKKIPTKRIFSDRLTFRGKGSPPLPSCLPLSQDATDRETMHVTNK